VWPHGPVGLFQHFCSYRTFSNKTKEARQLNGIALGYGLDDQGFESRQGLRIFLFATMSRTALGPTQPPIQWVPGALSLGVKLPGHETDHSPPSSAEVKEWVELYLQSPNMASWRRAQLRHRDKFTFTSQIKHKEIFITPLSTYLKHNHVSQKYFSL
jgi:hypothetical protein